MTGADFESLFRHQEERMAGKHPGAQERIDGLVTEGLGRAVLLTTYKPSGEYTAGLPNHQVAYRENIGFILPIEGNDLQCIVIFNTGDVFVIEPRDERPEQIDRYRQQVYPSADPLIVNRYLPTPLPASISSYTKSVECAFKIVLCNSISEEEPAVSDKFSKAIEFSKAAKARRQAVKRQSLERPGGIFDQIDNFLRGNPPNQPKPEEPTQPPSSE